MALVPIRPLRRDERERATATILLAFSSDPLMRWFWPEAGAYLEHMRGLVDAFAGAAFANDTAFTSNNFAGVCVWLPPGVGPDLDAIERLLLETTPETARADVGPVAEQLEHFHIEEPHWYLPCIGVEPLHHGQGVGAALMEHVLSICDQTGMPAYLESSNPRNISLYQRHGFERIGEIQIGSSPLVTPMRRPARVR